MTVLPQLERELRAAHARRRRVRWRPAWKAGTLASAVAAAASIAIALFAITSVGHRHAPAAASPSGSDSGLSARPQAGETVVARLDTPTAYAAGGELYVTEQLGAGGRRSRLIRLARSAGRTGAGTVARIGITQVELPGRVDRVLLAGGHLWVTTSFGTKTDLFRVDPRTLAGPGTGLPGAGPNDGALGSMAVADGSIWVGVADGLARVSLSTGRVTVSVTIPGAQGAEVAADSSGRVLLVSVGAARAHVERRDPVTGALLLTSAEFDGASKPALGAIVDGGAWISQAGGMMGFVQRLDLGTLRPTTSPFSGTNAIGVRLIDGRLWITQPFGGPERNFCADPRTGRPRARLTYPISSEFLAADRSRVYFAPHMSQRTSLDQIRIPAGCR
jgi:hypothetical protein